MTNKRIIVTREDFDRLAVLLNDKLFAALADRKVFGELASELRNARIVEASAVPPDVVTMNSTVRLTDLESGEAETYTLVYPSAADIAAGRLSILAPIGTAILGYCVGDRVRWAIPSGKSNMRIDEVIYQPERDSVAA